MLPTRFGPSPPRRRGRCSRLCCTNSMKGILQVPTQRPLLGEFPVGVLNAHCSGKLPHSRNSVPILRYQGSHRFSDQLFARFDQFHQRRGRGAYAGSRSCSCVLSRGASPLLHICRPLLFPLVFFFFAPGGRTSLASRCAKRCGSGRFLAAAGFSLARGDRHFLKLCLVEVVTAWCIRISRRIW